jgi:TRAP-type mannitol/chloroaromatic compound transport system substrate-binding protein
VKRREFLRKAGVGAVAAGAVAAPAVVKAQATISWRMASSFPKSLDTIYGAGDHVCKRVSEMTGGKFNIRIFAAGEIVPGLQVLDAVQAGTVECGHTAPYYYVGKDPTWAFGTTIPFGLNYRQYNAWWLFDKGEQLYNEFTQANGVRSLLGGNTGAQMGGWFRKEIKTLDDLKGLKFRIGGFAGQVIAKLGGVPQQIAGGDIYPSLEKGTIDAAEWVGPYDDEKLGFNKVAKFYYYPGWWEGGPALHTIVNLKAWQSLPKEYQEILTAASYEANTWMMSKYDAQNGPALRRLVASGTQIRAFPRDVMEASFKAANELYAETNAKNPAFKKIFEPYMAFRNETITWFRVTENTYDDFMATVKK